MRLIPRLTLFILLASTGPTIRAQQVKVKKADVFVDGQLFLQMPFRAGAFQVCLPGGGQPIFMARPEKYNHPDHRSSGNPQGSVYYLSIRFPGIAQSAEIENGGRKSLARVVMDFDLIRDGELDQENTRAFIEMTGTPYSDERSRIHIIETH